MYDELHQGLPGLETMADTPAELALGGRALELGIGTGARDGAVRQGLSRTLRTDVRGHQVAVFDMSRTLYVDDTAAIAIGELIRIALAQSSRTLIVAGLNEEVAYTLNSLRVLDRVPPGNIVADMEEAREIIRLILRQQ